jgi:predicted RNA-binding Zn ribbon-like protein
MYGLAKTDRLARLKTCASEECRWIFFDRSKPANRHWCASNLCGNRQKTRTYRRKLREQFSDLNGVDRDGISFR